MKNTNVRVLDRNDYDVIEVVMPNGAKISIETSPCYNEIVITHTQPKDEEMVIKSLCGNQFEIICSEIKY